jgi:hypothetical protein
VGLSRWHLVAIVIVPAVTATAAFAQNRRGTSAGEQITVVACVARQADYVRASVPASGSTGPQLLLTDTRSGTPRHTVMGLREAELLEHVGHRVEIRGTVERARTTAVTTTAEGVVTGSVNNGRAPAAGITPEGAAAHEPADALAATVPTGRVTQPTRTSDPDYLVASLPGLNATSFHRVAGACPPPAEQSPITTADTSPSTQTPAARGVSLAQGSRAGATDDIVVARGCLVRQTPGGTALTPQSSPVDAFVLSKASLVRQQEVAARGAVPGVAPADAGSGTVPNAAGTTGVAPVDVATQSFRLDVSSEELQPLTEHVGDRVEVTGVLAPASPEGAAARRRDEGARVTEPGRVQVAPIEVGHVTTPVRRIAVTAFRALGGACN